MNKYSSSTINEIHVINELNDEKKIEYLNKCPLEKKMFFEYYIYEINKTLNGKKTSYRFEIDKILCDDKIISEKFNYS